MKQLNMMTASRDELIVECRRLEEIVKRLATSRQQLRNQNDQLNLLLGEAQAGMELADIIKRMIQGPGC